MQMAAGLPSTDALDNRRPVFSSQGRVGCHILERMPPRFREISPSLRQFFIEAQLEMAVLSTQCQEHCQVCRSERLVCVLSLCTIVEGEAAIIRRFCLCRERVKCAVGFKGR